MASQHQLRSKVWSARSTEDLVTVDDEAGQQSVSMPALPFSRQPSASHPFPWPVVAVNGSELLEG